MGLGSLLSKWTSLVHLLSLSGCYELLLSYLAADYQRHVRWSAAQSHFEEWQPQAWTTLSSRYSRCSVEYLFTARYD